MLTWRQPIASAGWDAPCTEIIHALSGAQAEIERLVKAAKAIPARIPLGLVRPQRVRMIPERKRIHDAIRITTYNAESSLAHLLGSHYSRAGDEARSKELHVRLDPLSAPRRTAAITGPCEDMTATKTIYPGTGLTLVYSVKSGS